jgi:hypothetical protein
VQSGSPGAQLHGGFDFGFEDADATAPGLTAGGILSLVSSGAAVAIPLNDAADTAGDDVTFALRVAMTRNAPSPANTNEIAKTVRIARTFDFGRKCGSNDFWGCSILA